MMGLIIDNDFMYNFYYLNFEKCFKNYFFCRL